MTTKVTVIAEGAPVEVVTILHGAAGDRETPQTISAGTTGDFLIHNTLSLRAAGGVLGKGSRVDVETSDWPVKGVYGESDQRIEPRSRHSFEVEGTDVLLTEMPLEAGSEDQ